MKSSSPLLLLLLVSAAAAGRLTAQNAVPAATAAAELETPPTGLILTPLEVAPRVVTESLNLFGAAPDVEEKHHSLREHLPLPGDQGARNTCVAWTLAYGLLSYTLNLKDNPRNPLYTYRWALLNDLKDMNRIRLADHGCTFPSGFEALLNNGSCDLTEYQDFRLLPTAALSAKARKHRLSGERPQKQLNTQDLFDLKSRLLQFRALPAGFRIYQDFNIDPKKTAAKPNTMFEFRTLPDGKKVPVWARAGKALPTDVISKHAMLITGYDETIKAFEVMNSYGTAWGDEGFIWIDYEFFKIYLQENSPCCFVAYDYQDSVESFFENNGGRKQALAKVREGEITAYVRLGVLKEDQSSFPADGRSFDIDNINALMDLQPGAIVTVQPGAGKLFLRAGLVIDQYSGNTLLADEIGSIHSGDRFKISDIKRVRVKSNKTSEYWLQGTVEPPATTAVPSPLNQ